SLKEAARQFKISLANDLDEFINGLEAPVVKNHYAAKPGLPGKNGIIPRYIDQALIAGIRSHNKQLLRARLEDVVKKRAIKRLVLIFGHGWPEKDSTISGIIGRYLFSEIMKKLPPQERDTEYFQVILDDIDEGTKDILERNGIRKSDLVFYKDIEDLIKKIAGQVPDTKGNKVGGVELILFDHNKVEREELKKFTVSLIIDHHPVLGHILVPAGSTIIDSRSCTATIIAKMLRTYRVRTSPSIALMLLSAIFSDLDAVVDTACLQGYTFKSPTAIEDDVTEAGNLIEIAGIRDIAALIRELGRREYCNEHSSVKELRRDSKRYIYHGIEFCIEQAKIINKKPLSPEKLSAITGSMREERLREHHELILWAETPMDSNKFSRRFFLCSDEETKEVMARVVSHTDQILTAFIRNMIAESVIKKHRNLLRRLRHVDISRNLREFEGYFDRKLSRKDYRTLVEQIALVFKNNKSKINSPCAAQIITAEIKKIIEDPEFLFEAKISFDTDKIAKLFKFEPVGKGVYEIRSPIDLFSRKGEMLPWAEKTIDFINKNKKGDPKKERGPNPLANRSGLALSPLLFAVTASVLSLHPIFAASILIAVLASFVIVLLANRDKLRERNKHKKAVERLSDICNRTLQNNQGSIIPFQTTSCGGIFLDSYLPIVTEIFTRINLKEEQKFLDVGSGDGRVVLLAAMHKAQATGVEMDKRFKKLNYVSQSNAAGEKLVEACRVTWLYKDVLDIDISGYDVIFLYDGGLSFPKERLEEKIINEGKDSVLVVIQHERFPSFSRLKPVRKISNLYRREFPGAFSLYVKDARSSGILPSCVLFDKTEPIKNQTLYNDVGAFRTVVIKDSPTASYLKHLLKTTPEDTLPLPWTVNEIRSFAIYLPSVVHKLEQNLGREKLFALTGVNGIHYKKRILRAILQLQTEISQRIATMDSYIVQNRGIYKTFLNKIYVYNRITAM
ncbi:MAG: DHH family phosphoesterase, partial [Candidatus Omnitrophica bacterium]|nr:DHH family phosphoesterase [Candidatus Omnitrophota bacterium]